MTNRSPFRYFKLSLEVIRLAVMLYIRFPPVAIGRKNWMFSGSQRGGKAMVIVFTLIETAKLNSVAKGAGQGKECCN
jgi:hypothetical protein